MTVSFTNPHSTKGTRSNDKYYYVTFDIFNGKYIISGIAEAKSNDGKYYAISTVTDADIIEKLDKAVDKSSPEYEAYKAYEAYMEEKSDDRYYVGDGAFAFINDDEYPEYIISTGRSVEGLRGIFSHSVILSYQGDGNVIEIYTGFNLPKDSLQDCIRVDRSRSGSVNGLGIGEFTDTNGVVTDLTDYQYHYFRSLPCAFWELVKNNYDVEFVAE